MHGETYCSTEKRVFFVLGCHYEHHQQLTQSYLLEEIDDSIGCCQSHLLDSSRCYGFCSRGYSYRLCSAPVSNSRNCRQGAGATAHQEPVPGDSAEIIFQLIPPCLGAGPGDVIPAAAVDEVQGRASSDVKASASTRQ